jgi:hypothetical protein
VGPVYRTKTGLKEVTREKRGKDVRRKVAGNVKMPRMQLASFLGRREEQEGTLLLSYRPSQ